GDFPIAHSVWGTACSADPEDCNGNGNGQIGILSDLSFFETSRDKEYLTAWQHLGLAGMIEGSYKGIDIDPSTTMDELLPKSVLAGGHFAIGSGLLIIGTINFDSQGSGVLPAPDVFHIDSKLDDGKPLAGK